MTSEFLRHVRQRLARYWLLKAVGTSAFMTLFFWAYFSILNRAPGVPTVMPLMAIDHWIAFTPLAFPVYASLWIYVSLPPALIGNVKGLVLFGLWVSAMCLSCLALFWFFPTQTPPTDIDWRNYPSLALIKGVDASGNACPSLHVASAVFSACWLDRILLQIPAPKPWRWFSAFYCLAIAWSTMATLQHVAWDVICGAIVGLVFAAASLALVKNTD